MQNIWHQYLAIVVYSVFVCYLLFFLLWWQWKKSLCWYDDRISFVLSWWQGKAVFVVMMTGKTGSNIPVGPEPASALIRRSTTMLTCRARYSDIQNTTFFDFHFVWYFWGDQLLRYSIIQYHIFIIGTCQYKEILQNYVLGSFYKDFLSLPTLSLLMPHTHVKDCER